MAWTSRCGEWSRPPEPSPDASGMLVPLLRAATECEFDLVPEPGQVMQKGSDLGCEIKQYSGVRLTRRIAGFFEEVPAFVGAEQGADVAQGGPERLERARGRLAQERFELGERHLDW